MGNWKNGELGDFVTLKRGFDLPQQKREDGQVPIFSSSGITGTHSTAMVKAPGVITGRYGTIGEVFYAAKDFWPLNTTLFVEDFHGNDAKFIYYFLKTLEWSNVADGLFCREIDGLFCRSSPDIIVRRRCVLSHKRRGWLQPSPSFRYSRNLALQDELYHPVINNGPAVLVCVDKRLGTGPVNQSRDAG